MTIDSRTVATPRAEHVSMQPAWEKIRAVVAGEGAVKDYDKGLMRGKNLLIPFSTQMTPAQYDLYKSEARLLGFSSEFVKQSVGAMLRKEPEVQFPDDKDGASVDWIRNRFTGDDKSLISFLDGAIPDQMQTGNTYVWVDYDDVKERPVPVLIKGESVINWRIGDHPVTGKGGLMMLAVRTAEEITGENQFHPDKKDVVRVHSIDGAGEYVLHRYEENEAGEWVVVDEQKPLKGGVPLAFIPVEPLSGRVGITTPFMQTFVNGEVGHYNMNSRRNHLYFASSTFTPVITGVKKDTDRKAIARRGLGNIIFLDEGATASTLSTPTDQLKDLEAAIATEVANLAKLGNRALSPEASSRESGVSLDIRNSASSTTLAAFSRRLASSMRKIVTLMVNWRNGTDIDESKVVLTLSTNFSSPSAGEPAVANAIAMFEKDLIPSSVVYRVAKDNDFLPADLDESNLPKEIAEDKKARNDAGLDAVPVQTELNIPEE